MKQKYTTPKMEIVRFENEDVICTSAAPEAQSLIREGTLVAEVNFSDLMQ